MTKINLKFSIITAVRNGSKVIPVTLASVASQQYPAIEHIVIDGASTDDTAEIVRRTAPHVSQLISEPDNGVYDAFNKGLRLATGDVVAYLNAGDVYTDPWVINRVAEAFADSRLDAAFGDIDIINSLDSPNPVRRIRLQDFTPARLSAGFMPPHPALFIRRSAYDRVGEYDPSYRIAGDFEICVRLFAKQSIRFRHLPHVLALMPRGGLSNSGWRSVWTITIEMYRACKTHGLPASYLRLIARLPRKFIE